MDHSYSLAVDDVELRPLSCGDIESLRIWRNDAANSRYIRKIDPITSEMQEAWFASYLEDADTVCFAIDYKGRLAGSVSLYGICSDKCEFGKLMVGDCKGCGVGGRASLAALRVAFDHMELKVVEAEVSVDNTPAIVIYTRLGFCIVGRRYNEEAKMDEFLLSLTRERFNQLNP